MDENKSSGKIFKALVTGAILGATALFLSNKENREKAKDKLEDIKDNIDSLKDIAPAEDSGNDKINQQEENIPKDQ